MKILTQLDIHQQNQNSMINVIGFTGLAQSGKSTASSYLENNFDFIKVNFKSAMIDEIKTNFPDFLNKEAEIYKCSVDDLFITKPGSFRQFMQNYGTELRRNIDTDYWVNRWLAIANKSFVNYQRPVVVDDVRFLNEANIIKKVGGIIIRIKKEGQDISTSHQSETEMSLIEPDYEVVAKDGDIDDLCKQIKKIYASTK